MFNYRLKSIDSGTPAIMTMKDISIILCFLLVSLTAHSQDPKQAADHAFGKAAQSIQKQLEESIAELNALREQVANEKIPLSRKLGDLESDLAKVRLEYQQTSRLLDNRTLDFGNLRSEIKSREEESTYLSNLLGEYLRNFESRLHIAEIRRYRESLKKAKLAAENKNLSEQEVQEIRTELLKASLDRLFDALGGARFEGTAVAPGGLVKQGTFVLLGSAALFQSHDGEIIGAAETQLGSLEPTIIPFDKSTDEEAAAKVITDSVGQFPLDPTLGSAHKIEETKETFWEHVQKGGVVMYPIFALAGAAFFVALLKWLSMFFIRTPSQKRINELLNAVAAHDKKDARQRARAIGGPVGKMLTAGVEHLKEPRELIEEVMYEQVLVTRLKLESFLPFIAISAASAPLLGLLGTVTGIINTFKLITVFGSGDVKTLSGGISEALITTEFGLIVAIPSLLIHAFLSRKARSVINQMEKTAVAFINQIGKTPFRQENLLEQQDHGQAQDLSQIVGRQMTTTFSECEGEYSENLASDLMDRGVVCVDRTATVAEAIDKIRSSNIGDDIDSVFVVDEGGKYVGCVPIRYLLTRPEFACIESLAEPNPLFVRENAQQKEIQDLFNVHNFLSMPVLDHNDQLVGRIPRNRNGN
jgi:biopolymer transport protein ExbB